MKYSCFLFFLMLLGITSCGLREGKEYRDSVRLEEVLSEMYPDRSAYGVEHTNMRMVLQPIGIPDWIDVDSVRNYSVEVGREKISLLFPAGFTVPDDVNVYAFAKHDIDSATDCIWYRMQRDSNNKDIWVVMYKDSTGPVSVHCPATKGVGYGYARIDSPTAMREVFIDKGEKIIVTTKTVVMQNERFVTSDEVTSTFSPGNDTDAKVQALLDNFWK